MIVERVILYQNIEILIVVSFLAAKVVYTTTGFMLTIYEPSNLVYRIPEHTC